MNQSSLFLFQGELLQGLQNLTNDQLSLIEIPEYDFKSNLIKQNAELLVSSIEPLLDGLDKYNFNDYKLFYCYYTLLVICDDLERILIQLQDPLNIYEYIFYQYSTFILSRPEPNSVLNQKLAKILISNASDDFGKRIAQVIIDILNSRITFKDFSIKIFNIYNDFNYTFSINPIFTSVFFRLYVFILQNSPTFTDIVTFRYNKAVELQLDFSQMILSHILGIISIYAGKIENGREFNQKSLEISSVNNYRNKYATKNNLAMIYTSIGSYDSAQEIYFELHEKFPQNIIYALNLAGNYTFLQEYEKGIQVVNEFESNVAPFKNYNNGIALDIKFHL